MNSADDKTVIFSLFFTEEKVLTFHANCLLGNNLHEMSNPIFWENKKDNFKMSPAAILPSMISVKKGLRFRIKL